MLTINWEEFDVIMPKSRKEMKLVATIMGNGVIRLNSAMLKGLDTQSFEVRLKKDGKILAILPSGKQLLSIKKGGEIKNYHIIEMLENVKMNFPAYYVFTYDAKNQAFIGQYSAYNPNSKRSKEN